MDILKIIADRIIDSRRTTSDQSFGKGTMGLAAFLFKYAKHTSDEYYYDKAFETLDSIHDVVADINRPKLDSLALELGLTFSHLSAEDLIDIDLDEIMEKIDTQFHNKCLYTKSSELDDYLIPAGFYFLSRFKNTRQESKRIKMAEAIIGTIDEIKGLYAEGKGGIDTFPFNDRYSIACRKRVICSMAILLAEVFKENISISLLTPFLTEVKGDLDLLVKEPVDIVDQRELTTNLHIILALQCMDETGCFNSGSTHYIPLIAYRRNELVYDETDTLYANELLQAIFILQILNEKIPISPFEKELSLLVSKMKKSILSERTGGLFSRKGIPDLGLNGGLAGAGTALIAASLKKSDLPADLLLMFGNY